MNTDRLAEKAQELSAFTNSTTRYSNGVVLYTMFVLQDILAMQASQPEANLANITSLANSIAALNLSIRIT